jgi:hypothetical protein
LTGGRPGLQYASHAGIAQLVEHNLAKVGVASSSLVSRSIRWEGLGPFPIFYPRQAAICYIAGRRRYGWVAEWLCSGLQIREPRFDSGPSLHIEQGHKEASLFFLSRNKQHVSSQSAARRGGTRGRSTVSLSRAAVVLDQSGLKTVWAGRPPLSWFQTTYGLKIPR